MAPKDNKVDDLAFLVACLKHTSDLKKPDFDKVAEEIGADSGKACYYRHWSMLKKFGIGGSKATTSPSVARKRGRLKKNDGDNSDGVDADLEDTPAKKTKVSPKKNKGAKIASVEENRRQEEDEA